jgi:hypothetical protein
MVILVYMEGGEKHCRPLTSLEEMMKACNTDENVKNWKMYRQTGDDCYKRALVQVCYNCQVADGGLLKGVKTVSPFFFYDIDCRDREECRRIVGQLLRMKDELGLVEVSESASYGVHAVGRREPGHTILESQVRVSILTQTEMDTNNKENNRVVFHGPIDAETTPLLDEALFTERLGDEEAAEEYQRLKEREKKGLEEVPAGAKKANKHYRPWEETCSSPKFLAEPSGIAERGEVRRGLNEGMTEAEEVTASPPELGGVRGGLNKGLSGAPSDHPAHPGTPPNLGGESCAQEAAFDMCAELAGLNPNEMDIWGVHNWHANLMAVLSVGVGKLMSREQLQAVVAKRLPNYSQTEDCQKLIDYFYEKYDAGKGFMNASLRQINAKAQTMSPNLGDDSSLNEGCSEDSSDPQPPNFGGLRMPLGVKDSIEAVGPAMAMPMVTAICPCIGALATGVVLDVHGKKKGLNLISYIAGDFASGKGDIDPVIDTWMSEEIAKNRLYQQQEDEHRAKVRAAKNQKDQPQEMKLPVRYVTLNTTVANLAERLANTDGKHAFSYTPEADTVAQKWRSSMSDFSVMVRQSYDGSRYEREARSAEAVNVHIEHLLWNITMCGTPDCVYRIVSNYTDGLQSRIAFARTPDNTFKKLEDRTPQLTSRQTEHIQQVAHLLPLMQGEVVLPKLEAQGREWLESIRLETMMNDDRVKARQRFRICVTAQRMTCCLMLCKVCETLIQKHGLSGAETRLKQQPNLFKEMLLKAQTPQMLAAFAVIADSLMENALYFFRERIENAINSRDYAGSSERLRMGKNDTIFERLDAEFGYDAAFQQSIATKGADVTHNKVRQMLKNWKKQGLIKQTERGRYVKISGVDL